MASNPSRIVTTERLRLVPATPTIVDAELEATARFSALPGAAIPSYWRSTPSPPASA
jgi:hypothetical protein